MFHVLQMKSSGELVISVCCLNYGYYCTRVNLLTPSIVFGSMMDLINDNFNVTSLR